MQFHARRISLQNFEKNASSKFLFFFSTQLQFTPKSTQRQFQPGKTTLCTTSNSVRTSRGAVLLCMVGDKNKY